eukprot:gene3226-3271_t
MVGLIEKCITQLDLAKPIRALGMDADDLALLAPLCFITAKPAMYVGNVSDSGFIDNPLLDKLTAYAAERNAPILSAKGDIKSGLISSVNAVRMRIGEWIGWRLMNHNTLLAADIRGQTDVSTKEIVSHANPITFLELMTISRITATWCAGPRKRESAACKVFEFFSRH